jgi:hypothetical protein
VRSSQAHDHWERTVLQKILKSEIALQGKCRFSFVVARSLLYYYCTFAGLEHGLDVLGNSIGNSLPQAMKEYNTYPGGIIILLFTLVLGVGATIAEPVI